MADGPFDRLIINPREKPLSPDINRLQSQLDRSLRVFLREFFSAQGTGAASEGFLKAGLQVKELAVPAMEVTVQKGLGFQVVPSLAGDTIGSISGLDDLEEYKPLVLNEDHNFTVPTAPVGPNTRIDIIEVRAEYLATDTDTRKILNTATGSFADDNVEKTLTWLLDGRTGTVSATADSTAVLSYKTGVAANPGVAPSTTTGYIKLCEIAVGSAVTAITDSDISDVRVPLGPTKTLTFSAFDMVPYFPDFFQNGQQVDIELADDTGWSATGAGAGNFLVGIPLRLPPGSFIKSATGTIDNKGSTNTFTVRLRRCAPGGSVETLASDSRTTDGDVELADINHRVESGYRYWLNLAASRSETFWLYQATLDYKEF